MERRQQGWSISTGVGVTEVPWRQREKLAENWGGAMAAGGQHG